jgi:hypothetical protein
MNESASESTEGTMTGKHYFIEEDADGRFAVRAKESERASKLFNSQKEAEAYVKELNPEDRPDVERVRNTQTGGRDQWRGK